MQMQTQEKGKFPFLVHTLRLCLPLLHKFSSVNGGDQCDANTGADTSPNHLHLWMPLHLRLCLQNFAFASLELWPTRLNKVFKLFINFLFLFWNGVNRTWALSRCKSVHVYVAGWWKCKLIANYKLALICMDLHVSLFAIDHSEL